MTPRVTANQQLNRIVHLVSSLQRRGPQRVSDLATGLGITEKELLNDVNQLLGRIYYQPGGWVEDIQLFLEDDTIEVTRAPAFRRPSRLSTAETLCLMLALRSAVAQSFQEDSSRLERLVDAAEQYLAGAAWTSDMLETVYAADLAPDPVGIRQQLIRASREKIPCTITYLKPGQTEAETRTIHPWRIVHLDGQWHALAWCTLRMDVRQFRVDRMLTITYEEGTFEIPADLNSGDQLPSLSLSLHDTTTIARVCYDPNVVPWVTEDAERKGIEWTERPDGRVEILHHVADPDWLLHHVLSSAPGAEVLSPPELRDLVASVAGGFGEGGDPARVPLPPSHAQE